MKLFTKELTSKTSKCEDAINWLGTDFGFSFQNSEGKSGNVHFANFCSIFSNIDVDCFQWLFFKFKESHKIDSCNQIKSEARVGVDEVSPGRSTELRASFLAVLFWRMVWYFWRDCNKQCLCEALIHGQRSGASPNHHLHGSVDQNDRDWLVRIPAETSSQVPDTWLVPDRVPLGLMESAKSLSFEWDHP